MINNKNNVVISFMGGVGDFGMNITCYQKGENSIIVDCGIMFPDQDMIGVDYLYPDFKYIYENRDKFHNIIITHAHEDHIGAVTKLAKIIPLNIISTQFTIELIKLKFEEDSDCYPVTYKLIDKDETLSIGEFNLTFLMIKHSIISSFSLLIKDKDNTILHSSDFKNNYSSKLKDENIDLFLMDSTNSAVQNTNLSEQKVKDKLFHLLKTETGKIFITLFASNVERIKNIVDISKKLDKKIVLLGRSLHKYIGVAKKVGFIDSLSPFINVEEYHIDKNKEGDYIFLVTGSQGELFSALYNLSNKQHKNIYIEKGDVVIFSSKTIPGNESSISKIMNELYLKGAKIIDQSTIPNVHASGHATSIQLKEMLKEIDPKYVIPIHGDYFQLEKGKDLALESGVLPENIYIPAIGDFLEFNKEFGFNKIKNIDLNPAIMDGTGVSDQPFFIIKERLKMEYGILVISFQLLLSDLTLYDEVVVISKGFIFHDQNLDLIDEIKDVVDDELDKIVKSIKESPADLSFYIKKRVNKYLRTKFNRTPMVIPVIHYV